MDRVRLLLPGIWKEACRHIEIQPSVDAIAPMLAGHLPLGVLYVRRLLAREGWVETVAQWARDGGERGKTTVRTPCGAGRMRRLLAWHRGGEVLHARSMAGGGGPAEFLLPEGMSDGDWMAVPLGRADEHPGVLLAVAAPGREFSDSDAAVARAIGDPFSAALENDRLIREMAALREAAEADRRSLLARLGRNAMGDTIVGASSGLREVMERVDLVARSDAPVLIFGETGSGKELVARAIHCRSRRSASAFVRVNCGAIAPDLIDSQLFGHERGAFTGAVRERQGWFERAHGGTLLLDEVGELSPAAQVRLLRVLQDGSLERVGASDPIHVDVRIVAATHRDLAAMVAEGRFREDLWYRIAVFPLVLPPLRHRRQDIPDLARHFAERASVRFGLPAAAPTVEDIERLSAYDWPGNVRELAAVMDRAAILGDGRGLEVAKALGAAASPAGSAAASLAASPLPVAPAQTPAVLPLADAVRQHIELALRASKGRVEGPFGAARILRVNPSTLRAKMRKLRINRLPFRTE